MHGVRHSTPHPHHVVCKVAPRWLNNTPLHGCSPNPRHGHTLPANWITLTFVLSSATLSPTNKVLHLPKIVPQGSV